VALVGKEKVIAMYEVLVTYRPALNEKIVDRFPTLEEAQAVANRLSAGHRDTIIRAWVRRVREAKLKS
jgi:hypothetical protein